MDDPAQLMRIVYLFAWLFDQGELATAGAISRYLVTCCGWPAPAAWQVGYTWDVVVALRTVQRVPADAADGLAEDEA